MSNKHFEGSEDILTPPLNRDWYQRRLTETTLRAWTISLA